MALYRSAMDLSLAKPTPAHVFNAPADDTLLRHGHAKRLERVVAGIVTGHGNPHVEPYDGPVPAAAKRLLGKAEAAGMRAHVVEHATGCVVEGVDVKRGVGFRAHWIRGKTTGGSWHESRDRYTLIDDPRPVGVNKLTHTALAGHRGAGLDRVHLKMIAARDGLPLKVGEIERKVSEL